MNILRISKIPKPLSFLPSPLPFKTPTFLFPYLPSSPPFSSASQNFLFPRLIPSTVFPSIPPRSWGVKEQRVEGEDNIRMGRYMRKPKFSGELTVMEGATHQPSLGVCTRARAMAAAAAARDSSLSYLELRSRRLEKPPASKPRDPAKVTPKSNPSSKLCSQKAGRVPTSNSGSLRSARMRSGSENDEDAPPYVEVSLDENDLEPESRER